MKNFALILCILILVPTMAYAYDSMENMYPSVGVIFYLDYANDLVYFIDSIGHTWSVEGIEDLIVGDLIVVIMHDNFTPLVCDDVVVQYQSGGHVGMDLLLQWMRAQ